MDMERVSISELISRATWREAVTYRDTWPHEYVLTERDAQQDLLRLCARGFWPGRAWPSRFFSMDNTYLFIGDHKYWLMTDYHEIDAHNDEGDYVLNRARLPRRRRPVRLRSDPVPGPGRSPPSSPWQARSVPR